MGGGARKERSSRRKGVRQAEIGIGGGKKVGEIRFCNVRHGKGVGGRPDYPKAPRWTEPGLSKHQLGKQREEEKNKVRTTSSERREKRKNKRWDR